MGYLRWTSASFRDHLQKVKLPLYPTLAWCQLSWHKLKHSITASQRKDASSMRLILIMESVFRLEFVVERECWKFMWCKWHMINVSWADIRHGEDVFWGMLKTFRVCSTQSRTGRKRKHICTVISPFCNLAFASCHHKSVQCDAELGTCVHRSTLRCSVRGTPMNYAQMRLLTLSQRHSYIRHR